MDPLIAAARERDAADPLAFARGRFDLPEGVVYLDGNSLGALPRTTPERLERAVREEWGRGLISSWNDAGWMRLPFEVGDRIAPLLGVSAGEVVAGDSTSVALYKVAGAALELHPGRRLILTTAENFPSDLYVLQGLARARSLELRAVPAEALGEVLAGPAGRETALVSVTHVDYRSGRLLDLAGLAEAARRAGAGLVVDLSHSAGAVALDLNGDGVELAVGCGYKYLNGGPGAPAYMVCARRLADRLVQPLQGWIGHARPFAFEAGYAPAEGIGRLLSGTPQILGLVALEEGVKTFEGVTMAAVEAKSRALADFFVEAVEARAPGVFGRLAPAGEARRGSQVGLTHPEAYAIVQALIAAGVVGDFRAPDVARFGFTPLYLRFADVAEAVLRLERILAAGAWREERFRVRRAVT